MTRPLLAAACAILLCRASLPAEWVWQYPLPQGNRLWKAAFANSRIGFAVGDAGTILVTYDGGLSWQVQFEAVTDNLLDIAVLDSVNAFAVGDNGQILHTSDGGFHWIGENAGSFTGLNAVVFTDSRHGFIAGDARTILRTTDGGDTWLPASMPPGETNLAINTIAFESPSVAWAAGEGPAGGYLYRSTDGGSGWEVFSGLPASGLRLKFFPGTSGGVLLGAGGMIQTTTDGGNTWTPASSGTAKNLNDAAYLSATEVFIAGDDSTLLHSTNGGVTWNAEPFHGTFASINGLAADGRNLLALGEFGFLALRRSSTWTILNAGNHDAVNWIVFADRLNGFAVGQFGLMLRTTDGGTGWTAVSNGLTLDSFYGAAMVGQRIWAVGDLGVVLFSSDGGSHWTQQSTGTLLSLLSIWFTDQNNGWITGDQGTAFRTTDAGTTWVPQNVGTGVVLFGVTFTGATSGWITGDFGTIMHTTDGGSWGAQTSNTSSAIFAPSFIDGGTGFCGGGNGVILRTTNGGAAWLVTNTGYHRNIYLASGRTPAAVRAIGDTGLVLFSGDGGRTWGEDFSGTSYNIFGLCVRDDSIAWIGGDNGSILIHSGTGAVTSADRPGEGPVTAGAGFGIGQNFPNPFNPSTTFSYVLAGAAEIEVAVYDILGRRVAILDRGRRDAGVHRVTWDGTTPEGLRAPSGVYILRLGVNGAYRTRKISLVR